MTSEILDYVNQLSLLDHHVHGVFKSDPTVEQFSNMITESDRQPKSLELAMNSQIGFATRKWCSPLLDLPAHTDPQTYFDRRIKLGAKEVNRRLLKASGISYSLIETGYRGDEIHGPDAMAELAENKVDQIIRLETTAEKLLDAGGTTAESFISDFAQTLRDATAGAVGLKSIVAYRYGLHFEPSAPTKREVEVAIAPVLKQVAAGQPARINDPVLLRHLIYAGLELDLPIQFHIGFGDPDLFLHLCDPLLMTNFIKQAESRKIPIMLLHTYPFHRNAGYLAQMFDNVYLDVGLAINYTGARSQAVIAESLELAPFHKILFSSDAWGLPELTYLGAKLFRNGFGQILDQWVSQDLWNLADAKKVAKAIGYDNAYAAYNLTK
jgi:predicted TIM-barrel fold metal-dependent hydrolase